MNYLTVITDQLQAMGVSALESLPKLVISCIILMITWAVARLAQRIAVRIVGNTPMRENLRQLVETLAKLLIWILGLLVAAAVAIPGFTPASLIAGLGIGAVAIGFAFQDIFQNFLSGVLIMLRDTMQIGDSVEVTGISGKIEKITLRETHIRQFSNELTIVPNSTLFKNAVKILTESEARRDEIKVGVPYEADLEKAVAAIRGVFGDIKHLAAGKSVTVQVREFGETNIVVLVQWWVNTKASSLAEVRSKVLIAIKKVQDTDAKERSKLEEAALAESIADSGDSASTPPPTPA